MNPLEIPDQDLWLFYKNTCNTSAVSFEEFKNNYFTNQAKEEAAKARPTHPQMDADMDINIACAKLDGWTNVYFYPKIDIIVGIHPPIDLGNGNIHTFDKEQEIYQYTLDYDAIIPLINKQPRDIKEKIFYLQNSKRYQTDLTPKEMAVSLLKALGVIK